MLFRSAKAHRLANYVVALRKEILQLSRACGVRHPALVVPEHFELLDDSFGSKTVREVFGYEVDWSLPAVADQEEINGIMQG